MMKKFLCLALTTAALVVMTVDTPAKDGAIQCANLIYAGTQTSRCFSDEFLSALQRETSIATERRFKSVKLDSEELFEFPFVVVTGEADFFFTRQERENLKQYLESGGFLLASAGCSSETWAEAFRREVADIFGEDRLQKIALDHPIFNTIHKVPEIELHHPADEAFLEGMEHDGKIVLVFSRHGLNDTTHTEGCCCCGGNEISNSMDINVNILGYALLH